MIQQAIVQRIGQIIGVNAQAANISVWNSKFLLDHTISTELDDGEIVTHKIWTSVGQISNDLTIKTMLADISIDRPRSEYVLLCQLDDLSIYAMSLDINEPTHNKIYVMHNEAGWVQLSNLMAAKLLTGMEQIAEIHVQYTKPKEFQLLLEKLTSYVNFATTV